MGRSDLTIVIHQFQGLKKQKGIANLTIANLQPEKFPHGCPTFLWNLPAQKSSSHKFLCRISNLEMIAPRSLPAATSTLLSQGA